MAKKRDRKTSRLDAAAIAAGSALGALAVKVANINKQRAQVASEISSYIKQAQGMLTVLSVKEIPFPMSGTEATRVGRTAASAAPKKARTMSPAARKKIAAAQRARWAKVKAKPTL